MKLWVSYDIPPPRGENGLHDAPVWARSVEEAKPYLRDRIQPVTELYLFHDLGHPPCTNKCVGDVQDRCMPCSQNMRTVYDNPCFCPCHRPHPNGSELVLWMGDNDLFPPLIEVQDRNPLRQQVLAKQFKRYLLKGTTVTHAA